MDISKLDLPKYILDFSPTSINNPISVSNMTFSYFRFLLHYEAFHLLLYSSCHSSLLLSVCECVHARAHKNNVLRLFNPLFCVRFHLI